MINVDERCPTCGRLKLGLVSREEFLTAKQQLVILMAADGMTPAAIAAELYLSVETIRWHLKACYRKLGVHSRADAIDRARQLGLLAPETPAREGLS